MNNVDVERSLNDCAAELGNVKGIIVTLGPLHAGVPFLTKYALIKACGTIEQAFKSVIADHCSRNSSPQIGRFLDVRVRQSATNPSWNRICRLLSEFDENWHKSVMDAVSNHCEKDRIMTSLKSLVDARNDFAHGGSPSATIADVMQYFGHGRLVIEILDNVVR
jgi:hypothetical protein